MAEVGIQGGSGHLLLTGLEGDLGEDLEVFFDPGVEGYRGLEILAILEFEE